MIKATIRIMQDRTFYYVSAFSLIEMLLALTLLTFMLLTAGHLQLMMRQRTQQFYWQTIALQQMNNMLAAIVVGQEDINQWNSENAKRLPQGIASWSDNNLSLQWYSNSHIWNCVLTKHPHYACFSIVTG